MNRLNAQDIFYFLSDDKDFMENYLHAYMDRFVYITAGVETGITEEQRKGIIFELLVALRTALSKEDFSRPFDIEEIGNIVNASFGYEGFRKINVSAGEYATFTPVDARNIYMRLYQLADSYRNIWTDLDPFTKEAYFHIELMKIHPFEDGNKRTSKIIMNANLLKNGCAPILITRDDTKRYYEFLNNNDYEGLASFIKERSLMELQNMISQYKLMKGIPISESIEDLILNKKENKDYSK